MTARGGRPSPLEIRVLSALAAHGRLTRNGLLDAVQNDSIRTPVAAESIMLSCRRLINAGLVRLSHDMNARPAWDIRGYRLTDAGWHSLRRIHRELNKMSANAALGLRGRKEDES